MLNHPLINILNSLELTTVPHVRCLPRGRVAGPSLWDGRTRANEAALGMAVLFPVHLLVGEGSIAVRVRGLVFCTLSVAYSLSCSRFTELQSSPITMPPSKQKKKPQQKAGSSAKGNPLIERRPRNFGIGALFLFIRLACVIAL